MTHGEIKILIFQSCILRDVESLLMGAAVQIEGRDTASSPAVAVFVARCSFSVHVLEALRRFSCRRADTDDPLSPSVYPPVRPSLTSRSRDVVNSLFISRVTSRRVVVVVCAPSLFTK